MTIIDQRILIPAEPQVVWEYVSNLANNPKWIADCRNVSFLTTSHGGMGTRWRYTSHNNREFVVQVSAWYDGLGYEYTIVDGVPYKENRGRIRLQEIAEGTIVQWTFTYEVGGVLGGITNSLSRKRQVEGIIIDSLRTLWREISQRKPAQPVREAKSLMRDAPDVEARSQYKPRHPSVFQKETQPVQSVPTISEPPIAEEDTRPRKSATAEAPSTAEPNLLEPTPAVTTPSPPATLPEAVTNLKNQPSPENAIFQRPTPQTTEPATQKTVTQEHKTVKADEKAAIQTPDTGQSTETTPEVKAAADTSLMDTGKISVFDVFGLPKPSETQEVRPVETSEAPQTTELLPQAIEEPPTKAIEDTHPTVTVPAVKTGYRLRGWRLNLRRRVVKVRRVL